MKLCDKFVWVLIDTFPPSWGKELSVCGYTPRLTHVKHQVIRGQELDTDGLVLTNAASIKNTGLEIAANYRSVAKKNFSYSIGGNATFNKNKVIGLNGGQPILDGGIGAGQQYTTKTDNGQEVGSFYVLQVLGVFQTDEEVLAYTTTDGKAIQPASIAGDFKYQDTNGDGVIDDLDRVFVGSYEARV